MKKKAYYAGDRIEIAYVYKKEGRNVAFDELQHGLPFVGKFLKGQKIRVPYVNQWERETLTQKYEGTILAEQERRKNPFWWNGTPHNPPHDIVCRLKKLNARKKLSPELLAALDLLKKHGMAVQ